MGIQDQIARKYFAQWLDDQKRDPSPQPIMMRARNLNIETSLRVFCGNHIPEAATQEISDNYWKISKALELVNFPLAIPGTKVWRAIQCRKVAMYWLELAASRSKAAIAAGLEPHCMMEEWVQIYSEPSYKGRKDFTDREMALAVLSFLFASQDAMSSGLIYGFQHLADQPELLVKIREEQVKVRGEDGAEKPFTMEMWEESPYLRAFVKETLRVMPPLYSLFL